MIKLEPFKKEDFSRLISWSSNEEALIQFAGTVFTFPLTKTQLTDYVNDKNRLSYKVLSEKNEIIGHAEISPSEDKDTVKICRILIGDKAFRGKGLGKEIINKLLNIAFNSLNKNRAELNVYDWNIGAIKCYEKVGFITNTDKNSTSIVKSKIWNSINMIITKETFDIETLKTYAQ